MHEKAAAPTTTAMSTPGIVEWGMRTLYASLPIASSSADITTATTTPTTARLPITNAAGSGVPRRRLYSPFSRWVTIAWVRLTNDAEMMPSVMIPGT